MTNNDLNSRRLGYLVKGNLITLKEKYKNNVKEEFELQKNKARMYLLENMKKQGYHPNTPIHEEYYFFAGDIVVRIYVEEEIKSNPFLK